MAPIAGVGLAVMKDCMVFVRVGVVIVSIGMGGGAGQCPLVSTKCTTNIWSTGTEIMALVLVVLCANWKFLLVCGLAKNHTVH